MDYCFIDIVIRDTMLMNCFTNYHNLMTIITRFKQVPNSILIHPLENLDS